MHTLTFSLRCTDTTDDYGQAYRLIEVRPVIDGLQLSADVFDATYVLAAGLRPMALDIFTCDCGVAGCAGIFEEAEIQVSKNLVSWAFPESTFKPRLNADLVSAAPLLVFEFEKSAYRQALKTLKSDLLAQEKESPLPVAVAPDNWPDLATSLQKRLRRAYAGVTNQLLEAAAEQNRFQHLYSAQLEITRPDGCIYRCWVRPLLYALEQAQENSQTFEREVLPLLLSSDTALVLAVSAIPWSDFQLQLWRHYAPDTAAGWLPSSPPEDWGSAQWSRVVAD